MIATVKLYATLRQYAPEASMGKVEADLPAGTTIADLLKHLGIPAHEIKLCFVNSLQRNPDYVIQEGDRIALFSPTAGGI